MPGQTCFCLPVDPTVTHVEGLVLGSGNVGNIKPFIVALISHGHKSISLLKLAVDREVFFGGGGGFWLEVSKINKTQRGRRIVRVQIQNPGQVLNTERRDEDKATVAGHITMGASLSVYLSVCVLLIRKTLMQCTLQSVWSKMADLTPCVSAPRTAALHIGPCMGSQEAVCKLADTTAKATLQPDCALKWMENILRGFCRGWLGVCNQYKPRGTAAC